MRLRMPHGCKSKRLHFHGISPQVNDAARKLHGKTQEQLWPRRNASRRSCAVSHCATKERFSPPVPVAGAGRKCLSIRA